MKSIIIRIFPTRTKILISKDNDMVHNRLKLLAVLSVLALWSCDQQVMKTVYGGDSGFAFAAPVMNVEAEAEDNGQIIVPVFRGALDDLDIAIVQCEYDVSEEGSSEPQWSDTCPDGMFSLLSPRILFADRQYSSNAYIRYGNIDKLGIGKKYRLKLTLIGLLSPSNISSVVVTISRKLTFESLGECEYFDECIFEKAYRTTIYKAKEADIYRVMEPYTTGLIAEEYADAGWLGSPDPYIQFSVDKDESISFEPFNTGMLVNGKYAAYCYYPSEYLWGKDFSDYDKENIRISEKEFQLCAVYCLPSFQYGFLNEGVYKINIKIIE